MTLKAPKGRTSKLARTEFMCPWRGHQLEPAPIVVTNASMPGFTGRICHDCGCMVYTYEAPSPIVTPGGGPRGFSGFPIREPQPDDDERES